MRIDIMKNIIWSIAAAVVLLSGCAKDDEMAVPTDPKGEVATISEITVDLPQTRTFMGEGGKVCWDTNDRISVWSDEGTAKADFAFAQYLNEEKTKALFRTDAEPIRGTRFYAVYPVVSSFDRDVDGSASASLTLAGEQEYKNDTDNNGIATFARTVSPMAAQTSTYGIHGAEFQFSNLCSIVQVTLYGEDDADLEIGSISLTATAQTALYGTSTIAFPADVNSVPTLRTTGPRTQNTVTLSNTSVQLSSADKTFYFVVPAGTTCSKLQFDITMFKHSDFSALPTVTKVRSFATGSFITLEAGQLYNIGARFKIAIAQRYAAGDYYNENGLEGVVVKVDDPDANGTGTHGRIVALTDCNISGNYDYQWATTRRTSVIVGMNNTTDGWVNMTAFKAGIAESDYSVYPAMAACMALGSAWYLPASQEIADVYGASGSYVTVEGWVPFYYDEEEGVFPYYWTSSMYGSRGSVSAFDMESEAIVTMTSAQQTTEGRVRAMAKF